MNVNLQVNDNTLNPLEILMVADDLDKKGVLYATATKGNNCIYVYYGLINSYYIFRNGKIADIQYD